MNHDCIYAYHVVFNNLSLLRRRDEDLQHRSLEHVVFDPCRYIDGAEQAANLQVPGVARYSVKGCGCGKGGKEYLYRSRRLDLHEQVLSG